MNERPMIGPFDISPRGFIRDIDPFELIAEIEIGNARGPMIGDISGYDLFLFDGVFLPFVEDDGTIWYPDPPGWNARREFSRDILEALMQIPP